jgi:hypothetical protein
LQSHFSLQKNKEKDIKKGLSLEQISMWQSPFDKKN